MQASAYHLKPADITKLTVAAMNFRDRCLLKSLWWLGLRRHELIALDIRDIAVRTEARDDPQRERRQDTHHPDY